MILEQNVPCLSRVLVCSTGARGGKLLPYMPKKSKEISSAARRTHSSNSAVYVRMSRFTGTVWYSSLHDLSRMNTDVVCVIENAIVLPLSKTRPDRSAGNDSSTCAYNTSRRSPYCSYIVCRVSFATALFTNMSVSCVDAVFRV